MINKRTLISNRLTSMASRRRISNRLTALFSTPKLIMLNMSPKLVMLNMSKRMEKNVTSRTCGSLWSTCPASDIMIMLGMTCHITPNIILVFVLVIGLGYMLGTRAGLCCKFSHKTSFGNLGKNGFDFICSLPTIR